MTTILHCGCKTMPGYAYQDHLYGQGKRVHNLMVKEGGEGRKFRCTICRSEKGSGVALQEKSGEKKLAKAKS
jgi:hypothetical protein